MNELALSFLLVLARTTFALSLAALMVGGILKGLRVASPRINRIALLIVLLQGWLFFQWTIEIPFYNAPVLAVEPDVFSPAFGQGDLFRAVTAEPIPAVANLSPPQISSREAGILAIILFWLAGMIFLAGKYLLDYVRFVRSLPSPVAANPAWSKQWEDLQVGAGVKRLIPLRVTEKAGPMLCLLPRGYQLVIPITLWRNLSDIQRLAILRHELGHFVRGDVWKSLFVRLLALPHWFNPFAWRAVRRFDLCAEWACDEQAKTGDPAHTFDYAKALLLLSQEDFNTSFNPAASGGELAFRVRRLVTPFTSEDSGMKKMLIISLVIGLSLLGLARIQLGAKEPAKLETQTSAAEPTKDFIILGQEFEASKAILISGNGDQSVVESQANVSDQTTVSSEMKSDRYAKEKAKFFYYPKNSSAKKGKQADASYRLAVVSEKAENPSRSFPGSEAIVDVNYIFKNHDGFLKEQKKLKQKVQSYEADLRNQREDIAALQRSLQQLDSDGEAYKVIKRELERKVSQMKVDSNGAQREFLDQEAAMYEKTYNRMTEEIARFAKEQGIKIVRRAHQHSPKTASDKGFNRSAILQRVNSEVLYVDKKEVDITKEILQRMNRS